MKTSARRYKQHGTAAIELAIALPFLLFLMLAIAELGRGIMHYNELTKSTWDGARYLANHAIVGSTDAILIDLALDKSTRSLVVYGNLRTSRVPILPGLSTADVSVVTINSTHVRVDVDYQYRPLLGRTTMPMFGNGEPFDIAIQLRTSVAMRAL